MTADSKEQPTAAPEHLGGCIPAVGVTAACEAVRWIYGICPDHDEWCALGCPVTQQT